MSGLVFEILTPLLAFLNRKHTSGRHPFVHQMERFPVRPRGLIKTYARPCLVEWIQNSKALVKTEITWEQEYGLLTQVKMDSTDARQDPCVLFGHVPFALSSIRRWSLIVEERTIYAGITDCDDVAVDASAWIEIRTRWVENRWCYGLARVNFRGTGESFLSPFVPIKSNADKYRPGSRLDFFVDLSTNTLTLAFEQDVLVAAVPNLVAYRPFVYFELSYNRPAVRFLDPCD